jgi:hypothetical protein
LTLDDLDFLASEQGARVLARLAADDLSDTRALPLLTSLRRDLTPGQSGAALELARLRRKAVDKFSADAGRMFFTRSSLEQASDPLVRRYRAQGASRKRVVDACCGVGADSLAFAAAGADVTGLDLDPVRVAMARLNAAALGLSARFEVADVRDSLPATDLIFYDPARRDDLGNRIHHVERYQPPLSLVRGWSAPEIAIKLSPGVDLAQLESYGGAVEFISVDGDLKEATLRLGVGQGMTATLLTGSDVYHWIAGEPVDAPVDAPRAWLVEPDPSLLRAGLVADAALAFGGAQLDLTIAYFTTDTKPESPWLRAWRILDWLPFNVKQLRAALRERNVGTVTVKKRGSAVTPEALIPQLKLKGAESLTVVLTRCRGKQIVILCEDIPAT